MLVTLTAGNISRADRVLWSVTLAQALAWASAVWRQRTWWLQALAGPDKPTKTKPCAGIACTMCRKPCCLSKT